MTRFWRRAFGLAVFVFAATLLSACQLLRPVDFSLPETSVELSGTPFFPQLRYQCGPAALATLLSASGVAVTPESLVDEVYVPGRRGSFQVEMLAAARARGRVPVMLRQDPAAIVEAIGAGYPVLVLQNLRLRSWPAWHYAVVIGHDADGFLLRSGEAQRKHLSTARFFRSWDLAGRWAVVAADVDQVPPIATRHQWLSAAVRLESQGRLEMAHQAYQAAAGQWPKHPAPWKALANTQYARGDLMTAYTSLQQAVALDAEDVGARNNLAQVLLELNCPQRAAHEMQRIDSVPAAFAAAVAQTRAAVEAAGQGDAQCRAPD